MNIFPKFNFKQFENKYLILQTLGTLDTLGGEVLNFEKYCDELNYDDKILVEERAAIIEFEGKLSRNEAEFLTLRDILLKKNELTKST
ncbi:hypothetical protein [Candidatus Trichorickettsia mobilis]|uniref:hypothetical protein n=1 Tax=Candidatus Trichorickettsia mobilis TaxID=1346319 RepID=UPI00292F6082|nr:hypothetical protein [Candidatus Trichorickettsia mobilis]